MIKIKYTKEVKVESLPIHLTAKSANGYLRTLQNTAKNEKAFYFLRRFYLLNFKILINMNTYIIDYI